MKKKLVFVLVLAFVTGMIFSGGQKEAAMTEGFPAMQLELGHPGAATEENHMHFFAVKFQEAVKEKTNGKIKINIHPAGELGGEREMLEAVQLGTIDACFVSTGPLGNFVPEVLAFDFPFLFKDYDHARKVFDGKIGQDFKTKIRKEGIEVVVWAENGIRQLINSKRPINTANDLNGIKIRTMENRVHMATFRNMGADPTPISTSELYTALQQGVVDGMEGPLTWLIPGNFYEVQKFITVSNHFYTPSVLAMNLARFSSYNEDTKNVLIEAAEYARDKQREYLQLADQKMITMAEAAGVQIIKNKDFDRDSFVKSSQVVYESLGAKYKDVIDQIKNLE